MENQIKGGYYIKARCIQNSKIAIMPPYVREIWDWLLKEANHSERTINGTLIQRGQLVRTFKDIQQGLHWMVGWRKMTYKKWQCEMAMRLLMRATMIQTRKTTRGMFITILNYDRYQNPKNYDTNRRTDRRVTRDKQTTDTINKNVKNVKNEKKVSNNVLFETIWKRYPNTIGRKQAEKHFNKSILTDKDFADINRALDNYLASDRVKKGYIQNGSTWFNNFKDWINPPEKKTEVKYG